MELFNSIYYRGQGPAFLAPIDSAGNPLGFGFTGDLEDISGTPQISTNKVRENVTGKRLVAASIEGETSYPVSLTFKSLKPEHAAVSLQGDLTARAAGSVTDEVVVARHDKFTRVARVKCSNPVLTHTSGTPTYVEGTDYIFYGDEGMFETLSTGAIADGESCKLDYDYAAQKHFSANPQTTNYMLVFPGKNTVTGKRGRCTIFKLQMPPGFLGLIQPENEASVQVNAELLIDTLRAEGNQLYEWDWED